MKQVKNSMIFTIAVMMMSMVIVQLTQAQGQLNVTFRPTFSFPVKDLGATELKKGGGFEATVSYRFIPRLAAYAGWGWNTFRPEQSDNSIEHFEETGYRFGLQFIHPLNTESKLNILLSAGGVGNHIETENEQGDIIYDTGHGLGWEVDAALSIPLNDRWQIVPGIRYHALSREMTNGTAKESVDLNYISVGVGVSWTLVGH
jgi:hypothetical protein